MEIFVKRWKQSSPSPDNSFTNVKLFFEIKTILEPEEKELIKKYYDPVVALRSKDIRNYLSDYRLAMELSEKIRDSFISRVDKNYQLGSWDNLFELRDKLKSLIDWSDRYPLQIDESKNNENLSKYRFAACVHDGIRHLYEAEAIVEAITNKLKNALSYLKFLDSWDGEQNIIANGDDGNLPTEN